MILLVLLILSVEAGSRAEMITPEPEPSSVPTPTNLIFKAYNLNPVLHWEYQHMPQTPVFTVQVKSYPKGKWTDVCTNNTQLYCNIVQEVDDPVLPLWARVKARVGQKESGYVESQEYVLCQKSKIGPPSLDIKRWNNQLIVDIYHPVVEINGEVRGTMYDDESTCHTFQYIVYVRMNGSEILDTKHTPSEEDCNESLCQLSLPLSSLTTEYCISAKGFSEEWKVTTEQSNKICLTVLGSNDKDAVWIPVVASLALSLIVILVLLYWYIKKNSYKKKSIILPKSLLSVVRNVTSETKPESKYVSVITLCQPLVPVGEMAICVEVEEELSPATTPHSPGNAEQRELSNETEVFTTEKSTSDTVPESPSAPIRREDSSPSSSSQSGPFSNTLNSYHSRRGSDSGLVASDSSGSDPKFPPNHKPEIKTEEQESTVVRNAPTSFGYDKPHVLVDVAVGEGGQESLIGYRLAAESKDLPGTAGAVMS